MDLPSAMFMNSFLVSSPPREERGIYSQPAAARHAFSSGSHPYGFSGMSLCRYPDIRTKPSQPKTSTDAGGKPLRTREGGNGPACPTPGACPKILRNRKLNSDFNNLIKKYDQPLNILMHSLKRDMRPNRLSEHGCSRCNHSRSPLRVWSSA